ncbi:ABC transporter permease [Pelagibacterium mangrovi]|uniref:ABC transporter permease n=1 Tax=Pelagibacterium mangrovi TaxID=3119828 RepID=UPI002FCCAECB
MTTFILRRLLQWLPVLLVSSIVVFVIVRALPGDVVDVIAGPDAGPETLAAIREAYGLDQPLPLQYLFWLWQLVQGQLGISYIYNVDIAGLIASRIPNSLLLATTALCIAVLIGVPAGLIAGMRNGKWPDWIVSTGSAVAIATPDFWFGMIAIMIFAVSLGWLPAGGADGSFSDIGMLVRSLILPAATLALTGTAILARFTRSAAIETLDENFIRTARAKGLLPGRIIVNHVLRNSLVPVVTMMGIIFGRMLGGAVVIESLFAWPGIGRLLVQSILNRDYGVVQAILVLLVVFFLVINLIIDLLYAVLDPRIRTAMENGK